MSDLHFNKIIPAVVMEDGLEAPRVNAQTHTRRGCSGLEENIRKCLWDLRSCKGFLKQRQKSVTVKEQIDILDFIKIKDKILNACLEKDNIEKNNRNAIDSENMFGEHIPD